MKIYNSLINCIFELLLNYANNFFITYVKNIAFSYSRFILNYVTKIHPNIIYRKSLNLFNLP